ncbi:hypothetical protein HU200_051003 [Digitaria exilis]|uniref:Uncharacterized protein n=1 Tax=Digitaria exilis TaxID=1010633 RepID=A0A835AVK3_9POAL|nr:hypothetical protein HU200_051003 [Digitaria exilis]
MSAACFGAAPMTPSYYYSSAAGRKKPWQWWRAKCAGIAAAVGSRIRRSVKSIDGSRRRRRRTPSSSAHAVRHHHHRSFAPVYIDDLYTHQQQQPPPKALRVVRAHEPDANKPTAPATRPVHAAARVPSSKAAIAGGAMMRNVLLRSPGRGVLLGAVKGMGEVDLRAELFIRKFKEDMRLQSQRSAEEFQAMLARGL